MNNTCKKCGHKLEKHWYRMTLEPMSFENDYRYTVVADICNKCASEIFIRGSMAMIEDDKKAE